MDHLIATCFWTRCQGVSSSRATTKPHMMLLRLTFAAINCQMSSSRFKVSSGVWIRWVNPCLSNPLLILIRISYLTRIDYHFLVRLLYTVTYYHYPTFMMPIHLDLHLRKQGRETDIGHRGTHVQWIFVSQLLSLSISSRIYSLKPWFYLFTFHLFVHFTAFLCGVRQYHLACVLSSCVKYLSSLVVS